jgi:RNA polymerase sigma-70 factor (ECF subfamily)
MEVSSIYSTFHSALLGFIRSKIRSKEDAEDILQNVFIKISGSIESLYDEKKVTSWIYSITRNAIIDYYRSNKAKRNDSLDEALTESLPEEDTDDNTKGLDGCIGSMIAQLPDEYKTIILESELNGVSQKELAAKYDMAYPTVRSRVQRGRERLKQLFNNCCQIEADKHGNILDVERKSGCGDSCDSCS